MWISRHNEKVFPRPLIVDNTLHPAREQTFYRIVFFFAHSFYETYLCDGYTNLSTSLSLCVVLRVVVVLEFPELSLAPQFLALSSSHTKLTMTTTKTHPEYPLLNFACAFECDVLNVCVCVFFSRVCAVFFLIHNPEQKFRSASGNAANENAELVMRNSVF